MVTQTDTRIGDLIATLDEEGILEETLIIFSSDNGGALSAGASNGQLSGGKGQTLEGGTRVPGLVWWPDQVEGGRAMQQMIAVHDWLPTLLEAAGGDSASVEGAYGQSMWAAIKNGDVIERKVTTIGVLSSRAAYDWPWKLLDHTPRGPNAKRSVRLFNVLDDPTESTDLAAEYPERVVQLQRVLDAIPDVPSRRQTGPRPESYFRNEEGGWNYNVRIKETREPWAESATSSQ